MPRNYFPTLCFSSSSPLQDEFLEYFPFVFLLHILHSLHQFISKKKKNVLFHICPSTIGFLRQLVLVPRLLSGTYFFFFLKNPYLELILHIQHVSEYSFRYKLICLVGKEAWLIADFCPSVVWGLCSNICDLVQSSLFISLDGVRAWLDSCLPGSIFPYFWYMNDVIIA